MAAVEGLRIGDNMDPDTRLGPLVGKAQQAKVLGFIERARAAGVRSVTGDGTWPDGGEGGYIDLYIVD